MGFTNQNYVGTFFFNLPPPFPAICTTELHPSKVTSVNFADCGFRFVKMRGKNRGNLSNMLL